MVVRVLVESETRSKISPDGSPILKTQLGSGMRVEGKTVPEILPNAQKDFWIYHESDIRVGSGAGQFYALGGIHDNKQYLYSLQLS